MSAVTECWLSCDGCGEPSGWVGEGHRNAIEARNNVRGIWHVGRPGGRDICPKCWAKGIR